MIVHWLAIAAASAIECGTPVSSAAVTTDLADAHAAFVALDVDRFHLALGPATIALPGVDELVQPPRSRA
jgi:hypothetical protein